MYYIIRSKIIQFLLVISFLSFILTFYLFTNNVIAKDIVCFQCNVDLYVQEPIETLKCLEKDPSEPDSYEECYIENVGNGWGMCVYDGDPCGL